MLQANETLLPPETATKRSTEPKRRGRKSNKINTALLNVPLQPVDAETFAHDHEISLNALRQYQRFYDQFDEQTQRQLGVIKIRLNKTTRRLMIWREMTV